MDLFRGKAWRVAVHRFDNELVVRKALDGIVYFGLLRIHDPSVHELCLGQVKQGELGRKLEIVDTSRYFSLAAKKSLCCISTLSI